MRKSSEKQSRVSAWSSEETGEKKALSPNILEESYVEPVEESSTERQAMDTRPEDEEQEALREIKLGTKGETRLIRFWRVIGSLFLLATGAAVTFSTYVFLSQAQTSDFDDAFDQFSITLENAVVSQQQDIRKALVAFSDLLSSTAEEKGMEWPFFTMPDFELHAHNFLSLAQSEFVGVLNVLADQDRIDFEKYAMDNYRGWIREGHLRRYGNLSNLNAAGFHPFISRSGSDFGSFDPEDILPSYAVSWTFSPPPISYGATNHNFQGPLIDALKELRNETLVGRVEPFKLGDIIFSTEAHDAFHSSIEGSSSDFPHGSYLHPVNAIPGDLNSRVVAILKTEVGFDVSMRNLLPDTVSGLFVVLNNSCNQTFTYRVDGKDAFFIGEGDFHDERFSDTTRHVPLGFFQNEKAVFHPGHCVYSLNIYPSETFQAMYIDNLPLFFALILVFAFGLVAVIFFVYDAFVRRRNKNIILSAARTSALVTSLFPRHIRDQLIAQRKQNQEGRSAGTTKSSQMSNFPSGRDKVGGMNEPDNCLAELFLETTVLFADISGFTAWSSARGPSEVFALLETVFSRFDRMCRMRNIFKVETVGDCYVAVCGLPQPRKDHAIGMARFARDCLVEFKKATRSLEVSLGPDTSELGIRIGIHSGPVTAGVLKGDRARFQLFGDTVNTTARVESTGFPGRIHLSSETAAILRASGKDSWLIKREDVVHAKGKGSMQTYWLALKEASTTETRSEGGSVESNGSILDGLKEFDNKSKRFVEWNSEILSKALKRVIARRIGNKLAGFNHHKLSFPTENDFNCLPIDEVKEIIELPPFDKRVAQMQPDPDSIELSPIVTDQLRELVRCISCLYHPNAFHNFEHASHVVLSVVKLLSRIVAPAELEEDKSSESNLHDHTYGITSDPLTQFACAFSALIHDAGHQGVPNTQLTIEDTDDARYYKRSIAEQNSFDLSWKLLMDDRFTDFRTALLGEEDEDMSRFRALVVNVVLATDISDKELKELRNKRWKKSFSQDASIKEDPAVGVNRKATIVIEHLIQASDISHTMQHWHIYRKWNERLYLEMLTAYNQGRAKTHPVEFWYKGELGFFDFYIIPLAKKLKECGVFGVSSGEFLSYAEKNRKEWENHGQEIVASMYAMYGDDGTNAHQ